MSGIKGAASGVNQRFSAGAPVASPTTELPGLAPAAGGSHEGLLNEHNRHAAHNTHAGVDLAKLAKASPHLASELTHIISHSPRLQGTVVEAMVEIALRAPDLASKLFATIREHPTLSKPLVEAMPKIAAVYDGVFAAVKKEFPALGDRALARITESSIFRGMGKVVPVLGVGIAAWGSYDTTKAFLDPTLSLETKALFAAANSLDWGAAAGGIFAATGVGEAAAVAAAVSSIFLYARAEASKEADHSNLH